METEETGVVGRCWAESVDLQAEILARLPVEYVYSYRIISKRWKGFLSSNYFLTKWADSNRQQQPRLVLFNKNINTPFTAFCFHTRTWIKSCFTLSFLEDLEERCLPETWRRDVYKQSVGGLIFLVGLDFFGNVTRRLCNPYTQSFVDIPLPQSRRSFECIFPDENKKSDHTFAYKIAAVGYDESDENWLRPRQLVQIYEPSKKTWNIVGYFSEDVRVDLDLIFCNGSFYSYFSVEVDVAIGIVCFTMPPEPNGSDENVEPKSISALFAPFPQIVRNFRHVSCTPRMITCGTRLLLVAMAWPRAMPEQASGEDQGEAAMDTDTDRRTLEIIIWEFKNEGRPKGTVSKSKSKSWKWVEIARMPSVFFIEWRNKLRSYNDVGFLWHSCIGVGDNVCFVQSYARSSLSDPVEVIVYNLIDNTWSWLPSCPKSRGEIYKPMAFEPNLAGKVE